MAKTYPKHPIRIASPGDPYEGYITRKLPEAASQTFKIGALVAWASGYVGVFSTTGSAHVLGLAKSAGNNDSAGANDVEVILAVPGLAFYANFLGASGVDNVLAQTDLGVAYDVDDDATLADGTTGWYLKDSTSDAVLTITDFRADYVFPNVEDSLAAAGDTNARVTCYLKVGTGVFV